MAGKVSYAINNGSSSPTFLLSGQNYHSIGSLIPSDNNRPKFAQLYIYDTENEVQNRVTAVSSIKASNIVDYQIVTILKEILDVHNPLAKTFRFDRDRFAKGSNPKIKLKLIRKQDKDGRVYNLPTMSKVAILVVGDIDDSILEMDIIVQFMSNKLQRIDVLHPLYLALQYPLLFPYEKDGFRQFSIDAYTTIEAERLSFIRHNQPILRVDKYNPLHESLVRGEANVVSTGQRIILPSSFTGRPRYMFNNFLFADVCTVEFQKRSLLHAHILLFMHPLFKPKTPKDIDKHISAEIPDKHSKLKLYAVVEKFVVHGPCGRHNNTSPCMSNGHCSKFFPKQFRSRTIIDESGFPKYIRRDNGRTIMKKNIVLDNSYIVLYNRLLLLKYYCHINVEHTCQTSAIKYLFKYVHKGNDCVTIYFYQSNKEGQLEKVIDEIRNYYDCRYISACEVVWRIFEYDIQQKEPSIIRFSFHLPDKHLMVFRDYKNIVDVINRVDVAGVVYSTFKEACYALGVLQDDKEFVDSILEADLQLSEDQIMNLTLPKIEKKLQANNRSPRELDGMPFPSLNDRLFMDELNFDVDVLRNQLDTNLTNMNVDQMKAFDVIINAVNGNQGGFFSSMATIRSKADIVLNVASRDIASLLLPNGHTAHSRFKIPLDLNEDLLLDIGDGIAGDSTDGESIVDHSILAPTLEVVNDVNSFIMQHVDADVKTYLSSDTLCLKEGNMESELDTLTHQMSLMQLIALSNRLCNGTRLHVRILSNHVIECITLTGDKIGQVVLIPWMNMTPNNQALPFRFQRRQFPIIVSFTMTINKSQGKTLSTVGLYLPRPVFTHSQLYVALSRVTSKNGLRVLIQNTGSLLSNSTINAVYKEVFQNIS
ncbi:uncharacterized protein [Arachis hypogaea]|uniref:uncharacterized protein n=1 Tax=Arachis hypogaea TaxID=3818 RepID=UPI00110570D2|nr:uncharacterized protein LOC114925207 [Arachis hypogaea]